MSARSGTAGKVRRARGLLLIGRSKPASPYLYDQSDREDLPGHHDLRVHKRYSTGLCCAVAPRCQGKY